MTRPDVSPETDYSYVEKTTGHGKSFTPKADEAMVTFLGPITPDKLNDAVARTPLLSISQGINTERGFAAVFRRAIDQHGEKRACP